jgi:hypothetical protein
MKAQRGHILGIIMGCFRFCWLGKFGGYFGIKKMSIEGF